jgi:hypothetical protein
MDHWKQAIRNTKPQITIFLKVQPLRHEGTKKMGYPLRVPNPDKPELNIEDWRFVVSLRSVYYIKFDRLTFILFLFLFLRVRFLVSVFRIWDCVYLSWHLTPDTKFSEQKRFKKLTPTFIFVNACIPRIYKETEKYFALFAQNWIDNCLTINRRLG